MAPRSIGPYTVLDVLGTGGSGVVYRARDQRSGMMVAVKLLGGAAAMTPKATLRLAREYEALADIQHPNVVRVLETGVYRGYPFLAMELVEGLTLKHHVDLDINLVPRVSSGASPAPKMSGPITEETNTVSAPRPFGLAEYNAEPPSDDYGHFSVGTAAVREHAQLQDEPDTDESAKELLLPFDPPSAPENPSLALQPALRERLNQPARLRRAFESMRQLLAALGYIHERGIIHRDLKPTNIMVDEQGVTRLMDFGLSKQSRGHSVSVSGAMIGTFRYMAPEQVRGDAVDRRTDLYAIGTILFELAAGRPAFDAASPYALSQQILSADPPELQSLNPECPDVLVATVQRLMRKEKADRFSSAAEVLDVLSSIN